MKIGIALNEVLRDYIGQFAYTYEKYYGVPFDIEKNPITDFDLLKHELVEFETEYDLKKFLYMEAALEIFGQGDQTHNNIMTHFNQFVNRMNDEEEHEIEIVSREAANSIPATFFFLSKTLCKAERLRFVKAFEDKWDGVDVLITACPTTLESKPSGKISVKVNAPYNKDVKADFEIDDLFKFMEDDDLRETILNTKTVDFEDIK